MCIFIRQIKAKHIRERAAGGCHIHPDICQRLPAVHTRDAAHILPKDGLRQRASGCHLLPCQCCFIAVGDFRGQGRLGHSIMNWPAFGEFYIPMWRDGH